MDTTSHEFSWQYFEFWRSYHGSGGFSDIAIINDNIGLCRGNNLFGGNRRRDSLGIGSILTMLPGGMVRAGNNCRCMDILNGYTTYGFIGCVLRYDSNDIWFGPGISSAGSHGSIVHVNASHWCCDKMCVDDMKNVYWSVREGPSPIMTALNGNKNQAARR